MPKFVERVRPQSEASANDTPVYKVGAVILRQPKPDGSTDIQGQESGGVEVLIVQPIPKNEGEQPKLVLPRGSRKYKYQDPDGTRHSGDVRDAETARRYAHSLESLPHALLREVYEEAGMKHASLRKQEVFELGTRAFQSATKSPYDVHWYVIWPDKKAQREMDPNPIDALQTRWATLEEIEDLAERGLFSQGYLPVIREAVEKSYYRPADFPRVDFS